MPKNVEKRKRKTKARCNGIYLKKLVGSEIIEKSLKVNQRLNISFKTILLNILLLKIDIGIGNSYNATIFQFSCNILSRHTFASVALQCHCVPMKINECIPGGYIPLFFFHLDVEKLCGVRVFGKISICHVK